MAKELYFEVNEALNDPILLGLFESKRGTSSDEVLLFLRTFSKGFWQCSGGFLWLRGGSAGLLSTKNPQKRHGNSLPFLWKLHPLDNPVVNLSWWCCFERNLFKGLERNPAMNLKWHAFDVILYRCTESRMVTPSWWNPYDVILSFFDSSFYYIDDLKTCSTSENTFCSPMLQLYRIWIRYEIM